MTDYDINETAGEPGPPLSENRRLLTRQRSRLLWIAALVIVVDHISKLIIESTLPLYQSWAPFPALAAFFRISHVSNTGMAFGLFPAGSPIFFWAAILVSLVIVVYNYRLPPEQNLLRLALALQLGGALGNWINRIRIGQVTDFLDFGPWPVFNLADLSVVTGAFLLAWLFWQEERNLKAAQRAASDLALSDESSGEPVDKPGMIDEWSPN